MGDPRRSDASRAEFVAIGSSKATQVIVLVLSAVFCSVIGTIIAIVYLVGTRPTFASVAKR